MWFLLAVLALLCFGGMQLCFRYLSGAGLRTPVLLFFVFALATSFLAIHAAFTRPSLALDRKLLSLSA